MRETAMREMRTTMQAEPNVTPFLDVLLVLLILFMYLCLSQQKMLAAQLPDHSARPMDDTPSIVLEVRPDSMYAINTQPIRRADLASRLQAIYSGRPTKTIIVRATAGVRYQDVVTAVDIARGAGVLAIGLGSNR